MLNICNPSYPDEETGIMAMLFGKQPESRWQAFGIHLLISLFLFVTMCIIIVVFWYPGVLFTTEGGWQGVRLIAGVDFVIGPTLTLLVYNKGKKGLKYDLALIALLQALCISYGMYTVNFYKPAVIAYADNNFYIIPMLRYESRNIHTENISVLNAKRPTRVNIKLPEGKDDRILLKKARFPTLETAVDLYESFDHALKLLPDEGYSITDAEKAGLKIDNQLKNDHDRVFRMYTRYGLYAVLVDVRDGTFKQILGTLDIANPGLAPI
jgi:hypothetical protein